MTFQNAAILAGLFAVAIPVIIHLLNRRRFDVVDWAAMQFLHASDRRRRKILLDDWLLLAVRAVVVGMLVVAVAGPLTRWNPLGRAGDRPARDVVIVFDGSASMAYAGDAEPAHEAAKRWAMRFLGELRPDDGVAVVQARERPALALPFTMDGPGRAEGAINDLPKPRSGVDWPAAVQLAIGLLGKDKGRARDVVLLGDGQRHGWADAASMERWELFARATDAASLPRVWAVNVAKRAADSPCAALGSITADRTLTPVGREVRFRSELRLHGHWKQSPGRTRIEVDGRPAGDLKPGATSEGGGRIPLSFAQRFRTPGSHLVSLLLDGSPLAGLDRQDCAVEVVPAMTVLLVDGGPSPRDGSRSSDFLRDALAPARDPEPSFRVRQVAAAEFGTASFARPPGKDAGDPPRLLVLADVPRLEPAQVRAIESFLGTGGGVIVALGPNSDPAFYNGEPYRDGRGWLPARLGGVVGDEANLEKAARPMPASLEHPALALFKDAQPGGFASAYFPRRWKLETPGSEGGVAIAVLTDRLPLFAEKTFGRGRVIASAVPLDNSWRTNLTDLGDYVRLTHEMVYYLAGAGSADRNLTPRQPILYRPDGGLSPGPVTVDAPGSLPRAVPTSAWPLVFEDTAEPGVYKLTPQTGPASYFVVQNDPGEADLTPLSDADRARVVERLPTLRY